MILKKPLILPAGLKREEEAAHIIPLTLAQVLGTDEEVEDTAVVESKIPTVALVNLQQRQHALVIFAYLFYIWAA